MVNFHIGHISRHQKGFKMEHLMQQQQQKRPLRSEWIFKHGFSLRWLQLHLPPFLNGGIKILAAASRKLLCKERTSFKVKENGFIYSNGPMPYSSKWMLSRPTHSTEIVTNRCLFKTFLPWPT